jgi:hypothetical protein
MAYITGTSNYPSDFDLNPSGSGTTSTLLYVLDEIRDSNGVVTQSGNKVVAYDVNVAYTVLDQIERVLGANPEGTFTTVADRLQFLSTGTSFGASAFVHLTGDVVLGPLTMQSGASLIVTDVTSSGLLWVMSGNSTITSTGSFTQTAGSYNLSTDTYYYDGQSYAANATIILLNGSLISISGNIEPLYDGTFDIGSTGSYFNNLYVNNIITTGTGISSINGVVASSGGSIGGNLDLTGTASLSFGSGSSITNTVSGINQLADDSNPFGDIYTKTLHVTNITGMSPINILSNLEFGSGVTIGANATGVVIGSVSNPIDIIYASSLVGVSGLDQNAIVQKSGSDIFGNLTFSGNADLVLSSGSDISTSVSGVGSIGASGTPFADLYVNRINDRSQANLVFNETLTGTTDGVNKHFYFANSPTSAMVFVSGMLILPATQYVISGNSLFLTGSMYAPTSSPVAGFYIY